MSTQEKSDSVVGGAAIERRRSPRVEVYERIEGHMRPFDVPIVLLNVSSGGFLMQTPINYGVGAVHEFRFSTSDDDGIILRARIVRGGGAVGQYQFGLEFVDRGTASCEEGIKALLDSLKTSKP